MDASDFVERYWNLSVEADLPGAPFKASVSINKYLISKQENIGTIQAAQDEVTAKIHRSGAAVDSGMRVRLKNGKGSPSDMETFLSLAVEAGALKADEDALQRWADANLGVDCTGFVMAYLVETGVRQWSTEINSGASCPWIYSQIVKPNWLHTRYAPQPELWSLDDIDIDDLILWMQSGGAPETKHPGHISVVVNVTPAGIWCAESNGAPDGEGHSGPRHQTRMLGKIVSVRDKKWWTLGGHGVIVVRPSGS